MKNLEKIIEKKTFLAILGFSILIFILPQLRIFSNPLLLDSDSYYHVRIAKGINENTIEDKDHLSYQGSDYHLNLSDFILSNMIYIELFARIIPIIFGIATAFLAYKLMEILKFNRKLIFLAVAILISSPVFIYIFSTFNYYFIPVFLNFLLLYFLLSKKYFLTIPILLLIPFFNLMLLPVTLFILLAYHIPKKNKMQLTISSLSLFFSSFAYYFFVIQPKDFFHIELITNPSLSNLVSDFGSYYGMSIFTLMLASIGFFIFWNKKENHFYFLAILMFFLIPSFYFPFLNIFLNFLLAYLAALAFLSLQERQWEQSIIKSATTILIICGLLFSTISFITQFVENEPTKGQAESLIWLHENNSPGVVFSHYSNGHIITYFSKMPSVADAMFTNSKDLRERLNDSETIFHSRSFDKTKFFLDKYNITYIWIDSNMKSGQVWTMEDEGLLFLLRNDDNFIRIYSKSDIEIWEYIRKNEF